MSEIAAIESELDRHLSIAIVQVATVGLLVVHFSRVSMPTIGSMQRLNKIDRIKLLLEKVGFVIC